MYIPPDMLTIGRFEARNQETGNWDLIASGVRMYLRPRISQQHVAAEINLASLAATKGKLYHARLEIVNHDIREGNRLIREEVGGREIKASSQEANYLFVLRSDILGDVQQLILGEKE